MRDLAKFSSGNFDLYYSLDSVLPSDDDDLADFMGIDREELTSSENLEQIILTAGKSYLDRDSLYKQLVMLNARRNRLPEKHAILHAHGDDEGEWIFVVGSNAHRVQDWIGKHDGKYSSLILCCCNPGSREIASKKSAVLAPNSTYSGILQEMHEVKVELYLPEIGYVNDYEAEALVRDFRRKIKE